MRILVTGGAGFIGAHLTEKLIRQKHKLLVVDSLATTGGIPYINPKSKFINGDITEDKIIKKIEKWRPEIIYHLAAQSGSEGAYDNPKKDYMSNGFGTYKLTLLAKKIKVKHFVYTSTVAVYGSSPVKKITEKSKIKPDSIYGISKYAGEMFVDQVLGDTKVKTAIFRIFNTYGPGEDLNFLKKGMVSIYCSYVWQKKPIIVKGKLERFRNLNLIDDCIEILAKTLKNKKLKKNEIINLSSGKMSTVKEIIEAILKARNLKNYKIIIKKGTPGDSFGLNASNKYLLKKFKGFKFSSLSRGLKIYFKWIDTLPTNKSIKKFHPLNTKTAK